MNILHINCSPQKEESSTRKLAKSFLEGYLKDKKYNFQEISLYDYNLKHCTGCLYCIRSGNPCPLKDDLLELCKLVEAANIVVWNIPHLGPGGVPSKLKIFLERSCNQGALFFSQDSCVKDNNILILGCGYPTQDSLRDLEDIEKMFKKQFGIITSLIIPETDLLRFYPEIKESKLLLKKVKYYGQYFQNNSNLEILKKELKTPAIPEKEYISKYLQPLKLN